MPTPDMSDEELDQLFRHGAAAYPPHEAPLAEWWHLSTQLDELARQRQLRRRLRRRVAGLFALEIGLVALLLLWKMPGGLQPISEGLPPQEQPLVGAPAPRAAGTGNSPAAPRPRRVGAGLLARVSTPQPPRQTNGPGEAPATASARPAPAPAPAPARGLRRPFALPTLADLSIPATDAATTPALAAVAADTIGDAAPGGPTLAVGAPELMPGAPFPPDSGRLAGLLAAPQDSALAREPARAPTYRLLLGLVGGPELTAVGARGPGPRLGGTVGLTAEYRLSSRLRVRSGLLRSVKRYAAHGSDYNPPPGYWTWRVPVEQVDANCRILEIPLDLRYEVVSRPTYSVYATAGLTSLLMRQERYTYFYELNGQYLRRSWSLARGSNAALRLVSLSLGLERPLGGRWVGQAEPFVKLPLSGVGFGKVPLSSAGLLVGVRYGLLRPRAPAP